METSTDTRFPDHAPACAALARLLDGVEDRHLAGPTPCPDYTVRDLLAHLTGLTLAFRDAGRKALGPTTDTPPTNDLPTLEDDWRTVLPERLNGLVEAWRAADAWEGFTRAGGVDLPGEVAGIVALNEVLVHGWDLARSTGQAYEIDSASLEATFSFLEPAAASAEAGDGPEGLFGPPVRLPADAPLLDRVIGLSGRRPDWRPGE
ncbi:TIGR03086 family metal-binding protein [Streptomyces sp. NBC_01498]|uniref:TIGR03086 family metal-binding protein n=1 Tax=Streptomyces sp. NBC_01498 TaxID=2975870 RepID=UPI002E7AC089|nr:TIGR03086 family metal-binding protein [Streptomyces sp. NBC_01498]WTL23842.1 TIGR03086 family metal-binding protein [Streptomyces sp. NBC_01498]